MKKLIGIILVLAIVAVGGYYAYDTYLSPEAVAEKNLMGEWVGSYEIGGFTFKEEGALSINVLGTSAEGKYTADFETGEMSITYTLLGLSHERSYTFEVTESTLTLTDTKLGITSNYSKVTTE